MLTFAQATDAVDKLIDRDQDFRLLGTGYGFTEGPAWNTAGGYLVFSDIPGDRRWRWSEQRGMELDAWPTYKGVASPPQGLQQAKGPAAIQALVEAMPGSLLGSEPGADFHVVVNPLIELDAAGPGRARAEVTWLYVVKSDDGLPAPCKLGHYDDRLIREAGRWRFLRREAPTDIG